MNEKIDETMSSEQAFSTDQREDTFNFEETKEVVAEEKEETKPESETPSPVGSEEEEEQKVPYSRFKKKLDEATEYSTKVKYLEEQLEEMKKSSTSKTAESSEIPAEWVELYGDSETSRKAWNLQKQLDDKRQQNIVENAIKTLQEREQQAQESLVQNEEILETSLAELATKTGIKLTTAMEESILEIVDEFSPVDKNNKYISLFPFEKAYEIYKLRNQAKGKVTQDARKKVADITGNSTQGESSETSVPFERGWDSWRKTL